MKRSITLLIILVFVFFTCRNSSNKTNAFVFPDNDSIPLSESVKLSPEAVADISKNITSPVEIANLLLTLEVPFSPDYLASTIDANKQSTNFDKAIKLGILGADLGYLNIYEKTGSTLDVLSSIRKLSEDLNVSQFFDFESIRRLSQNRSNLDSLLFISIDAYSKIDDYLRANEREQLSALLIIGVWLEGQYLATQVVEKVPDKILSDRIGEQKIILNDLIFLISPYCNRDSEFRNLCTQLTAIKDKYRDIRITYTQGDPVSVEKNGGLTVTQTETSVVEMSKEQLGSIIEITKDIRNRFVLNN